jgi:hypothetical protein
VRTKNKRGDKNWWRYFFLDVSNKSAQVKWEVFRKNAKFCHEVRGVGGLERDLKQIIDVSVCFDCAHKSSFIVGALLL